MNCLFIHLFIAFTKELGYFLMEFVRNINGWFYIFQNIYRINIDWVEAL